ncbi:major facilitator superfamily domain-containing protein [Mycena olivaceomarginata]|nr:major facilitator superfamily domain-containing protein [Mycena olivaceomarginata]
MDAEKPGKEARFENVDDNSEGQPIHKTETNTTGTDAEKGSTSYAASTTGLDHKIETSRAERASSFQACADTDIVILPLAVLLYLSAYLDRGNLGNARLQGLQATVLRGSDTNYSLALSCFYITYILLSVPGTLLAKAILPSTAISIGALIWSIAATCQAATFSPAALYVSRLFVGVGESLFGQSMGLYLTYWYLPDELSKRIGLFISAGSVAGAFGGLISYGVSSITHPPHDSMAYPLPHRRYPLFRPRLHHERTLALTRLNTRHVGKGLGLGEGHTGVDWKAVKRALLDWKTYVVSVIYSCMNLCLGSVTGFLPTIVKGLGYSDANAQLLTVPPYVVALVFMLLIIAIVGWAILLAVPAVAPTYSDLHARGTSTNIAFSALGLILTLFMAAYYRYENARRNKNELGMPEHMEGGDAEEVGKYDLARGFRYTP